jgi:hypothetical protein
MGNSTGSGTYTIRLLTGFDTATGSLVGSGLIDTIGDLSNTQAGLAVFNVDYSDGSRGALVVSCTLAPFGRPTTPPSIFEGITASKSCPTSPSATCGSVDYWNRENGLVITTADQTIFHIVPKNALAPGQFRQGRLGLQKHNGFGTAWVSIWVVPACQRSLSSGGLRMVRVLSRIPQCAKGASPPLAVVTSDFPLGQ